MSDTTQYTIPARPTTYKGVEMRSRLEAGFAQLLDRWEFEWEYEPQCYADETGQYLPDFEIKDWSVPAWKGYPGGRLKAPLFVETKPMALAMEDEHGLTRRISIIRSTLPMASLAIWFPEDTWFLLSIGGDPGGWTPGFFMVCPVCRRRFLVDHMWMFNPHQVERWWCPSHPDAHLITLSAFGEWQNGDHRVKYQ